MNALAIVIAIAACVTSHNPTQAALVSAQQSSLEKAVADTQQVPAQDLDPELPRVPFGNWFKQLAGPGAGVVWQVSECGDAMSPVAGDIRACVEANSILSDGRRVILMVAVGTFRKGQTGAPAFQFGVVERGGELLTIRRLRDLQKQLLAPGSLANRPAVKLPEVNKLEVRLSASNAHVDVAPWGGEEFGRLITIEEPDPPPAGSRPGTATNSTSNAEMRNVSGAVRQGSALVKPQPAYPRGANKFNVSGPVEVQITISAEGRVTAATASSGHPLLRKAAEDAARRWEFNPTTVDGVPIETQLTLTFIFTVPPE
jgi:TonB family protein